MRNGYILALIVGLMGFWLFVFPILRICEMAERMVEKPIVVYFKEL